MTDLNEELDIATQRSPKYPYIALDKALERAATLNAQVRDTPQTREAMARAYGKPATSSATIQTFATLTQFGLLEPVLSGGQRKVRVTALARNILNPNAPDSVTAEGRKTAALKPAIFRELWERFGSSEGIKDGLILYYLTQEREEGHGSVYTEKAAHEVLRVYRATLQFAGLSDEDIGSVHPDEPEVDDSVVEEPLEIQAPKVTRPLIANAASQQTKGADEAAGERELQSGMLSKTASYRVVVSGHIGVKEIERLIRKLEMDKEILADEDALDPLDDVLG